MTIVFNPIKSLCTSKQPYESPWDELAFPPENFLKGLPNIVRTRTRNVALPDCPEYSLAIAVKR